MPGLIASCRWDRIQGLNWLLLKPEFHSCLSFAVNGASIRSITYNDYLGKIYQQNSKICFSNSLLRPDTLFTTWRNRAAEGDMPFSRLLIIRNTRENLSRSLHFVNSTDTTPRFNPIDREPYRNLLLPMPGPSRHRTLHFYIPASVSAQTTRSCHIHPHRSRR
jgi:hypothetical protein